MEQLNAYWDIPSAVVGFYDLQSDSIKDTKEVYDFENSSTSRQVFHMIRGRPDDFHMQSALSEWMSFPKDP